MPHHRPIARHPSHWNRWFGLAGAWLGIACGAHAALFDWSTVSWAAGATSGGQMNVGGTLVDVTVNITKTINAHLNDSQPSINFVPISDGNLNEALQLDVDYFQEAYFGGPGYGIGSVMGDSLTVHVTFSQWVSGVSFGLLDVDRGTDPSPLGEGDPLYGIVPNESSPDGRYSFVDSISHIRATDGTNEFAPETIITSNGYNTITTDANGIEYVHGINTTSDDHGGLSGTEGAVTIDFGGSYISGFSFTYSSFTPNNLGWVEQYPTSQAIAFGDIDFTPVPEVGTTFSFGAFLLGALWLGRRRARLSARTEVGSEDS